MILKPFHLLGRLCFASKDQKTWVKAKNWSVKSTALWSLKKKQKTKFLTRCYLADFRTLIFRRITVVRHRTHSVDT